MGLKIGRHRRQNRKLQRQISADTETEGQKFIEAERERQKAKSLSPRTWEAGIRKSAEQGIQTSWV